MCCSAASLQLSATSSIKVNCSSLWLCCIGSLLPESCSNYTMLQSIQVRMKFGVVTEVSTFLVITQVSSGLKNHIFSSLAKLI